jgi:hypothetical protein
VLGWQIFLGKDRLDRTFWHTRAAVNAGVGVNIEIFAPLWVVLGTGNDAFDRANLDTSPIPNANGRDYMGHIEFPP